MFDRLDISDFNLNPEQTRLFVLYAAELIEWNKKFNLTAIRSVEEIWSKHFSDSLSILLMFAEKDFPQKWVDIGTGAGFPGLPLKIAHPEIQLTLVDSIGKKIEFCRHVSNLLQIETQTIAKRAEELGQDSQYREKFDCACARAVANLPTLCELLLPLIKIGGVAIIQKSYSAYDEIAKADNALDVLGGKIDKTKIIQLKHTKDDRLIIQIRKINHTPAKYPRRAGIPLKRPL